MKRFLIVFILFLMLFQFAIPSVEAKTNINDVDIVLLADEEEEDCAGLLVGKDGGLNSFGKLLQELFNYFKFLAPTLVVVLTIVEFAKAAAANDKDALAKAAKTTGTRIVLALVLFFLPTLINFIFDKVLHWYGTCGIY